MARPHSITSRRAQFLNRLWSDASHLHLASESTAHRATHRMSQKWTGFGRVSGMYFGVSGLISVSTISRIESALDRSHPQKSQFTSSFLTSPPSGAGTRKRSGVPALDCRCAQSLPARTRTPSTTARACPAARIGAGQRACRTSSRLGRSRGSFGEFLD